MANTMYVRNNETISGRLHDELVMMDIEKGKYFSLNQVATVIWDMLEQPLTLEEICNNLTSEYDVDPAQCKKEVETHLNEMQKLGLIVFTS